MNRTEWLQERRMGLGGTDSAAIMGVSKFKTPMEVCLAKWGELPETPQNDLMRYGLLIEPVLRQWYVNETGRTVTVPDGVIRHSKQPFLLASLDGFTDDGRVLEIKTASRGDEWGEPGSDEIPDAYMCQVQHYMYVTGAPVADVVVSIMGKMPVMYEVEADKELHDMMIQVESDFWHNNVLAGVLPDYTTVKDIALRFRKSTAGEIKAAQETLMALSELKKLRETIKAMESKEEQLKAAIMATMGEFDTLVGIDGKPIATWKSSKATSRFDTDSFKKTHADLYKQFTKTGEPSRRFCLK